jgi:hypothetical protein
MRESFRNHSFCSSFYDDQKPNSTLNALPFFVLATVLALSLSDRDQHCQLGFFNAQFDKFGFLMPNSTKFGFFNVQFDKIWLCFVVARSFVRGIIMCLAYFSSTYYVFGIFQHKVWHFYL